MQRGPDALGEFFASCVGLVMFEHQFTVLVVARKSPPASASSRRAMLFGEAQICNQFPARSRSVCLNFAHVPFELCRSRELPQICRADPRGSVLLVLIGISSWTRFLKDLLAPQAEPRYGNIFDEPEPICHRTSYVPRLPSRSIWSLGRMP